MVIAVLNKKTDLKAETSSIAPFPGWLKSLVIVVSFLDLEFFIQLQMEKGHFQSTS